MQARRGFVPDDERNFCGEMMPLLHKAGTRCMLFDQCGL